MTVSYAKHFSAVATPQSEPIPGTNQVENSAGGFSFAVDDWTRLDRFLVLGSEGGSYYATEKKLTVENAESVRRCLQADGARAVNRIVEVSEAGRAPKNDPAIFALAMAAGLGDTATKQAALAAVPKVCRIGTHLFQFVECVEAFRGHGRALNRALRQWYADKEPRSLAYQVTKYQQRNGWSHRDILRLCRPRADGLHQEIFHWIVKGWPGVGEESHPEKALHPLWAMEKAKRATTKQEVVQLIRDFDLVRECVPTQFLTEAEVWEALLDKMPLTAMIRNLATMTRVGLLTPLSKAISRVMDELTDPERLKKSRVHPLNILVAMRAYAAGRGERGANTWTPLADVLNALDTAFYLSFKNVEPTGKRWLLALDVSGSMSAGISGMSMSCREAAAAMSLVTANVERHHFITAFQTALKPLAISPRQRLTDAVQEASKWEGGGTDCSQPMLYALERSIAVDAFVVYTDSETWAGSIHPVQALRQYRQRTGIPAKLIVVGMVANQFTIADPSDGGMMDVVGFDTSVPAVMSDFVRG